MTHKELNIHTVMERLLKKEFTIKVASLLIHKSERQTKRIKKKYKKDWPKWIIHGLRWKPPNHKHDPSKYKEALSLVKQKYNDYWPTLAQEKLYEKHNIQISIPTLRTQMIQAGIWKNKKRKKQDKQFTARLRKENNWEMIQYDGSYHKWFEGRNKTWYQCLLVWIDDATWFIDIKLATNEWINETFAYWKEYIQTHWKPKSIYCDKFATYKINYPDATDDRELMTQFQRVCKTLWIELIFANTPQAKWRVERMNATLQDRLVKAFREENIHDMKTANTFIKETFLPDFNKKFMVIPQSDSNMHLSLRSDEIKNLDQIFSEQKQRKIANDFTIRFENKFYQLFRKKEGWYRIQKWDTIIVEKHLNWDIKISKNETWAYILHKESFKKPDRQYKFPLAPTDIEDRETLKKKLEEEKERVRKEKEKKEQEKEKEKENKNTKNICDSKKWMNNWWMNNFNFWNKTKSKVKI